MRPRGHGRRECEEGVRKWGRGKEKRPAAAKASQLGTSTVLDLPLAVAKSVAGGFARPTSPIRIGILAQANNSQTLLTWCASAACVVILGLYGLRFRRRGTAGW